MKPMLASYIGQQVTVQGRGINEDFDTDIVVGNVAVSGPPVMRTVLLNATDPLHETLSKVVFTGEAAIVAWEESVSASYRPEDDELSWPRRWHTNWAPRGGAHQSPVRRAQRRVRRRGRRRRRRRRRWDVRGRQRCCGCGVVPVLGRVQERAGGEGCRASV